MNVLVTGGAGYIGSHAVKRLLADGHSVSVADTLRRGHAGAIQRLRTLPGVTADRLHLHRGDVGDRAAIEALLRDRRIEIVLHFAGLAYVTESVSAPLLYFRNNLASGVSLLEACDAADVPRFIFSSTCATYGMPPPERIPITESCPQEPINPYGFSKLAFEHILRDHAAARRAAGRPFAFAALRYFNVAGCDASGLLGEDHDPETHVIPLLVLAGLGRSDGFTIAGTDYATPDGTCIRDYVHVDDLVDAHVSVMNALKPGDARVYNVGIGRGVSVREVVDAARRVSAQPLSVKEGPRRPGDPPVLFADPSLIRREIGWSAATTDLDRIIETAWRWFKANPSGYGRRG